MKDFVIPGLDKTENEFTDIQAMDDFFSQTLIGPDGGGWYRNKNYNLEDREEDDPSTHEYQWFDTLEDREGFEYIGSYYISKNEESTQMTVHFNETEKGVWKLKDGKLDMIVTSDGSGSFILDDDVFYKKSNLFEVHGGATDFNYLTARLVDADIKFGNVMFVGHGTYDYSQERFMRVGSDPYILDDDLFSVLKGTNFADSFDASSNLILYQCAGARATKDGLKADKAVYQKLSQALSGASIYVSYGAVLPNPFDNRGDTTGDSEIADKYFTDEGIKKTESIKKIIMNNALWLKVQDNEAYHLYGFRLNLNEDQLEITIEESKEARTSNFK